MSLLSRLAVQAARAYGILSSRSNNVSADYLVVAGGGGGAGGSSSGGGGAGGLLTSTTTLSTLNTYSITVGAGGGGGANNNNGNNGANSVVSGTGLSTITAIGGGGGGGGGNNAANGGSGGGAYPFNSAGTGTSGQGNNGGAGSGSSPYAAGGGGGAGAVGGTGSGTQSGAGGNGLSSSISGSSVTYAGGGGGGGNNTYTTLVYGAGGSGGGGAGQPSTSGNPTAGTANTGGGGGGASAYNSSSGGNGGSGIVIISYTSATPKFVGGTITTSGGKQIHTFTSSGTLSPITPITASYLVVAGGGSSGDNFGGGGGAGGLLTSSTTLYSGATYVVTVGAGASANGAGLSGNQGSNSSVSGTGLTTITATGGGYGGENNSTGGNGGSGGGGGGYSSTSRAGGTGTSGQGNNGGAGGLNSALTSTGGGGGGAGAIGNNGVLAPSASNGNGGIGVSSSISGTATYYAGGGGGGAYGGNPSGAGGQGGGGAGASATNGKGVSGTANTGGGGGGSGGGGAGSGGAAGGSGIVIISYAGSQVFNGGLVTTSGGNTIHTFTSTGALTPLTNNLNNSLRFRSSASATLTRTPTSSTNRKTWTWSNWIKRGNLGVMRLCGAASSSTNETSIYFDSNNKLAFVSYIGSENARLITTQVFRDPSAWYHIVVTVDTTQATAANRIKMYVNGNQVTAFDTATYPSQNYETIVNSTTAHYYGTFDTSYYYDGYVTDAILIDGQALEPYYFGNNDANGVWKPIQYKGTYGTNGFYLTFGNTTSTTTLGYDSSPNGNNWTCNNISLTAGTTYDAMTDVPTNTSATVANYCVLNPVAYYGGYNVLSQGNLQFTSGNTNWMRAVATFAVSSGKWYWEITANNSLSQMHGILTATTTTYYSGATNWVGYDATGYAYFSDNGQKWNNNAGATYGSTFGAGDIIGVAFDADNGTLTFYKNNVSQGTAFTGLTSGPYVPAVSVATTSGANTCSANFGQRPFTYTPPTGFVALNTYNLPTPTILQGNKYMDATLWTGNGASTRVFNGWNFRPDFVWMKARNTTHEHALIDSNRGTGSKVLNSNSTAAEWGAGLIVSSFDANGFTGTTGTSNFTWANANNDTYVGWGWNAGSGTTSSNTSGSITSTVSVNTTAGFSIVTYTGTGANATVGHGLGVAPAMIITKQRNSTGWWGVYNKNLSAGYVLILQGTNASTNDSTYYTTTAPTSSVFSVGTSTATNGSASTYVSYCWAEIAGFSKFGSYTGNGSADGPFVYTGFRPKFILIKETTTGGTSSYWFMWDSARNTYNLSINYLLSNVSDAEGSSSTYGIDIVSNGFKIRNTNGNQNTSGNNYIYAAFAENPFKNANAR